MFDLSKSVSFHKQNAIFCDEKIKLQKLFNLKQFIETSYIEGSIIGNLVYNLEKI